MRRRINVPLRYVGLSRSAGEVSSRSEPGEGLARKREKWGCGSLAVFIALVAGTLPSRAQPAGGPPQAFLLGAWTGGLFPPPTVLSAGQCLAQPSVIFTRDVVMRATFTDAFYIQRLVETARGTGNGVDLRFSAAAPPASAPGLPALTGGGDGGFGCESADVLHVQRITPNEIRFPGCSDFPFPLVRCPGG